jgi:hypothetical protein
MAVRNGFETALKYAQVVTLLRLDSRKKLLGLFLKFLCKLERWLRIKRIPFARPHMLEQKPTDTEFIQSGDFRGLKKDDRDSEEPGVPQECCYRWPYFARPNTMPTQDFGSLGVSPFRNRDQSNRREYSWPQSMVEIA